MSQSMMSRHNSHKRRWGKIKSNPELLEKHRAYNRNRKAHILESSKQWHRNYRKEMRETARDLGNCTYCYKEKSKNEFKMCANCREKHQGYRLARKSK